MNILKKGMLVLLGLALGVTAQAATEPSVNYVYNDHLGTPRVVVNSANKVIWQNEGEPFGNVAPQEDPDGDGVKYTLNLRFPGQYYDSESGRNQNYYRDYNPQTGRYVQSDPIGLGGGSPSTYLYVNSNPLDAIDVNGLEVEVLIGGGSWYSHAAVRVNNNVYSNGRYPVPGEEPILGGTIGPNVLTVQQSKKYYETSLACGCGTKGYLLNVSEEQEKKIEQFYKDLIKTAEHHPVKRNWYILPGKYSFIGNNCATLSSQALINGLPWYQDVFISGGSPFSLKNSIKITPGLVKSVKDY